MNLSRAQSRGNLWQTVVSGSQQAARPSANPKNFLGNRRTPKYNSLLIQDRNGQSPNDSIEKLAKLKQLAVKEKVKEAKKKRPVSVIKARNKT